MPSVTHEALLQLFRNRPELAPELLREALRIELPAYTEARIESADFSQLAPTEYHADLVVLLVRGAPVLGIVVEVQLAQKARKRFTWSSTSRRCEPSSSVTPVSWSSHPPSKSPVGPQSRFAWGMARP